MSRAPGRQGELFDPGSGSDPLDGTTALPLLRHQLVAWQGRLADFQQPLFDPTRPATDPAGAPCREQGWLFPPEFPGQLPGPESLASGFNPLALAPQSLQFWRWPQPPQGGAAIYVVIDQPPHLQTSLLLYVGETGRAELRWKGEHDCKTYLSAYAEAMLQAKLTTRLSIRFWCDVPAAARSRRALEQALIRRWLPPFNKETRQRWATPFTSDPA
ncbi:MULTISPECIES: GIY-YIG nuclease family protein [Synechococcales]|uniref:GIY-YIG nuclease family protein n=1 Tax=Synechococcus sp. CS-1325 TaxID=2847979 RepID=UPI00223BE680|nr:GIY-YIG nuclease family protein [Synechococcus sp. CS-1325]